MRRAVGSSCRVMPGEHQVRLMAPIPVSGFISVAETTAHSAAVWRMKVAISPLVSQALCGAHGTAGGFSPIEAALWGRKGELSRRRNRGTASAGGCRSRDQAGGVERAG